MSVSVHINDAELQRKIAKFAILSGKGLEESTRAIAARFTKAAISNTPPMILKKSASAAKSEWTARVTNNYMKKPFVRGQWLTKTAMAREIAKKKKQLGRDAAGWNAAARQLKAKAPAWVTRHSGEGSVLVRKGRDCVSITISNRVPYGQKILQIRSNFVLQTVKRGVDGTLRAMKRKLIRSVK